MSSSEDYKKIFEEIKEIAIRSPVRFEPSYVYAPYVPLQVTDTIMKPQGPKAMHVTSYPRKKLDDIILYDGPGNEWLTSINWDIDQSGELVAFRSQRNTTIGVVVGQRIETTGHAADVLWISPPVSEREMAFSVTKNRAAPTNVPSPRLIKGSFKF